MYKTPIADSAQRYLQRISPHHISHYILLMMALIVASIPWCYRFKSWTSEILLAMAIPILGVYWMFQFFIMQSSVCLAKHDQALGAPDILLKTIPPDIAIFAQVRAVLRHNFGFIVGISLALLSLSLAITSYLYYWPFFSNGRGILKYVGVVSSGYSLPDLNVPDFPYLRWPATILLSTIILFMLIFTNSLVSASIGLWAGHLRQAVLSRLGLLIVVCGVFLGLYTLRETPALQCQRNWMQPNLCDNVLFQMRLIDSFQVMSITFEDGGAVLATSVHLPEGTSPTWEGYQWRGLLVGIATVLCQIVLSLIYLRYTHIANRRRGIVWLLGIYDGEHYLWQYHREVIRL